MFGDNFGSEGPAPGTTGKYLVLMREDAVEEGIRTLDDAAGLSVATASDFDEGAVEGEVLAEAEAIVFDELAVALVDAPPEQIQALSAATAEQAEESPILAVEPERVVYAIEDGSPIADVPTTSPARSSAGLPVEFLRGYRDAVNHLTDRLLAEAGLTAEVSAEAISPSLVESTDTWGLQVTKASASRYTGEGIRVAVLDTGFDELHPDFAGRSIESRSFVPNQAVQDGHGHGTHCIGTSCGPRQPNQLPRYGVASGAEILVGKVLSNQGSGGDGGILAGMNWAISKGCQVVSMSLGSPVQPGQRYSRVRAGGSPRLLAGDPDRRRGRQRERAARHNCARRASSQLPLDHGGSSDQRTARGGTFFRAEASTREAARWTSPDRGSTSSLAGHGRRSTEGSAGRAWPRRTWLASPLSTPKHSPRLAAAACGRC